MPIRKKKTKPSSRFQNQKIRQSLSRIQLLEKQISLSADSLQEKLKQIEQLNTFSSQMSASLDLEMIQAHALHAICEIMRCEASSVLLVDRKKGELFTKVELTFSSGSSQRSSEIRIPIDDQTLSGAVVMSAESVVENSFDQDPRSKASQKYQPIPQVRNVISVPLIAQGRVVGAIEALNKLPSVSRRKTNSLRSFFGEEDLLLMKTLADQVSLAVSNSQFYSEIQQHFYDTVEALAEAIEKKDHYTGGHTKRVAHFAVVIAQNMKLSPDQLRAIRLGAILHDVGKIGIDDQILRKNAPLTEAEWTAMKTHPQLGFEILRGVEGMHEVTHGIRFHHERWDGKGYPKGLKGEEIPLVARVISVADAYDAMVSNRPYRKGIGPQNAYSEIVNHQGTQFDPAVVEAFIRAFEKGQMGRGSGEGQKQDQKNLKKAASS